jgi:2-hydroxycyclohexanecarboxyl-CoA dehydrogenase
MLMTQAFVPQMVERQHGIVVNIASVAAHIGVSHGGIYATLKAAVTHYTRCLADEVREHGVRVNAVSPGPAKTARFQATRTVDPDKMNSNKVSLDRYAEPEEIADAVVFLCSPEAKFIHGQLLRVDGGLQLYAG